MKFHFYGEGEHVGRRNDILMTKRVSLLFLFSYHIQNRHTIQRAAIFIQVY